MSSVAVVGAGVAGLVAARRLTDAGHDVVVLDKGRVVGGRTASRRPTPVSRHDQGAQFVTLQHDEVADLTDALRAVGALVPWFHGAPDVALPLTRPSDEGGASTDGHPRYRGGPSARGPAQVLAAALPDVRTGVPVLGATVDEARWQLELADGSRIDVDALVCTAPAPQARELLRDVALDAPLAAALAAVVYDPCWTLLARPDGVPAMPTSGAARIEHDVVAFVADEQRKGTSPSPAVTVHSTGAWARIHLEDDPEVAGGALASAAGALVGTSLTPVHVHRWRYATPVEHGDDPAPTGHATATDGTRAPIALAGDGFVGGRVEGAMRSGHLAGTRLAVVLDARADGTRTLGAPSGTDAPG